MMIALVTSAVLLGACAGGPFADGPIPTVPEADPPAVPTLDRSTSPTDVPPPTPTEPPPVTVTEPATPTTPSTPRPAAASPPADVPEDPVELGRSLGVDGLVDLLAVDPLQAGDRGEDLLRSLQGIAERPDRSRIERLQDQVENWVDNDALDPQIAQAVLAALAQQLEDLPARGPREDDDENDDDDH